ncbi:hypothetical protein CBR_g41747 [Chara braunii]|uniref:Reverse transcriptase domain-containing protein n=1 Tax=Chara braunii TaxID=69332 RepID=A0A388LWI5_CHABU|nr:hypothetical protein CBR_g41747 [Chara braunii]|eukprot:GBG86684.1 hypothetical protein CBR_g41747 [Chara braunii]
MANGETPGNDGLPVEFYRHHWEMLGESLVSVYYEIQMGGVLPVSACRGIISLLFKKGDTNEIRNWRSISLLNVSYKILVKVLTRRLGRYLPQLVADDQAAFVQGRSIYDNIVTAVEALDVVNQEELEVSILLLDMEKAYDRVNWSYVFSTLKWMNFGDPFCTWVVALYSLSTASVMVNGHISAPFKLSRSLRQGCPLAPLLFIVHLEVLLNNIRAHVQVVGLETNQITCKVKALADDLFAISTNTIESMTLLPVRYCLKQYEELSEATINWQKSVYFLPEQYSPVVKWGMKRIMQDESERFLGVQVALSSCAMRHEEILQPKVKPEMVSHPGTKEEVLSQIIFENHLIRDTTGSMLMADAKPGSFGRRWMEKGVVRLRDLWDEWRNNWIYTEELEGKLKLGKYSRQRMLQVLEAVPDEWKRIFSPEFVNLPGTWYEMAAQDEGSERSFLKTVELSGAGAKDFSSGFQQA